MNCRMFSTVSGLYLLDASSTPIGVTINVSRHCHMVCRERITGREPLTEEIKPGQGCCRRKESCVLSVDPSRCRQLLKVLSACWRSKTGVQKGVSTAPPLAWLGEGPVAGRGLLCCVNQIGSTDFSRAQGGFKQHLELIFFILVTMYFSVH